MRLSIPVLFVLAAAAGCGSEYFAPAPSVDESTGDEARDSRVTDNGRGDANRAPSADATFDSPPTFIADAAPETTPETEPPPVTDAAPPPVTDAGAAWIPQSRYGTTFTVPLHCGESSYEIACDNIGESRSRSGDQTVSVHIEDRNGETYFQIGSLSTYGIGPSIPGGDAKFDGNGTAEATFNSASPTSRVNQYHRVKLQAGSLTLIAHKDTWDLKVCSGRREASNHCVGSVPWDGYAP